MLCAQELWTDKLCTSALPSCDGGPVPPPPAGPGIGGPPVGGPPGGGRPACICATPPGPFPFSARIPEISSALLPFPFSTCTTRARCCWESMIVGPAARARCSSENWALLLLCTDVGLRRAVEQCTAILRPVFLKSEGKDFDFWTFWTQTKTISSRTTRNDVERGRRSERDRLVLPQNS